MVKGGQVDPGEGPGVGRRAAHRRRTHRRRGPRRVPGLFGESSTGGMTEVATLTGGRTFDARAAGALPAAFKEIRGYQ